MTPFLINEGSLWALGIAWYPEALAAFFAWWMPLNLLSYLLFLATAGPLFGVRRLKRHLTSLWYILLMTVGFLPEVAAILCLALWWTAKDLWRDHKKAKDLKTHTIDWKTQGAR